MFSKLMKQISYGERGETKDSTAEIEIMANAMFATPMHPGKQLQCFAEVSVGCPPDPHQT
jgi:hypothetical protein